MNLSKINWNKESYHEFIIYLKSLQDPKYLEFHSKLLNDNINLIGIKTPILKKMAKEISKGDYLDFIKCNNHNFYEEIIIHGLIIGYVKEPFDDILCMLNEFLKYNTNWAINDIVCANLKIFKKNIDDGYNYILKLIESDKPFDKRFGIVLLLDFYINDKYIDKILDLTKNICDDNYYVKMAVAWLISICYIKYPAKTIILLKKKRLNDWIHNKAIQKIIESTRIDKEQKEALRTLKIDKR